MIVSCPSCTARFNISDASLAGGGRKVKCGRCSHVWRAMGPSAVPEMPRTVPAPTGQLARQAAAPIPSASVARSTLSGTPLPPAQPAPRAAARAEGRRGGGLWVWWLLLLVLVGGVAGGGYFARGWVVETWPPSEWAYDWLGIPLPRIEIVERTERESEEGGTQRLIVGGVLTNRGERELPVPPLVFTLYDARGEPVNQWREPPPVSVLSPGETVPFTSAVGISSGEGAVQPRWEVMLLRDGGAAVLPQGDDGDGGDAGEDDEAAGGTGGD